MFTPENEKPVYVKKNIVEKDLNILSACFIPHQKNTANLLEWQATSQLYYLTSDKVLDNSFKYLEN